MTEKPATIAEDRPMTDEERTIAEYLLRHAGAPEALAFVPQLDSARVIGRCSCGCPTIDLAIPPELRVADAPAERLLADASAKVAGKTVGAMMFQYEGLLTMLEVYRLEDFSEEPFGLPSVDTIERISWKVPGQGAR
jgi:hypothetical protein